jgi:DNA-binding PadR family transcriptional regulator
MPFPTTSYILLGMLSAQEMSGYDLKQQLDKSLYPCYESPAKSQIYGELRRLTQQGWTTVTEVPQTHRPDKRVYRITQAGLTALRQWLANPDIESDSFKSPFLLRLFFGHLLQRDTLVARLEARRQQLTKELAACEETERTLRDQVQAPHANEEHLHSLLIIRFRISTLRAAITWTDDAVEQLTHWGQENRPRAMRAGV